MQAPLLTQTALPFQGLDLLHDFAHLCESALDVLPQVMFVLSALLFIGEGCAVRGRLPLLSACLRMQGMREGRPCVLGFLQEGIDHRNTVVSCHGDTPCEG